MRTTYGIGSRKILGGLVLWLAVLLPPFSVVGFDTWLNTEQFRMDYEYMQVSRQIKDLSEGLDHLKDQQTDLESVDRMREAAPYLGLVEPQPDQIEIVYYSGDIAALRDDSPYVASCVPGQGANGTSAPRISLITVIRDYVSGWMNGSPAWNKEQTQWNTDAPSSLASTSPMEAPLPNVTPSGSGSSVGDS